MDQGLRQHALARLDTALERDPDFPGAAKDLAPARRIVAFVETAQETGEPGDQPELKADDAAYDNVADRGQEAPAPEEDAAAGLRSADQWLNALDTRPADFLRLRFAMEAAQRPAGKGGNGMAEDAE